MFRSLIIFSVFIILSNHCLAKEVVDSHQLLQNYTLYDTIPDVVWSKWLDEVEENSRHTYTLNTTAVFNDKEAEGLFNDRKQFLGGDDFGEWEYRSANGKRGIVNKRNIQNHMKQNKFFFGNWDCPFCKCGVRSNTKIVNGQVARKNEFPWIGLLRYQKRFFCGSSLISSRFVMTAAHCIYGINVKDLTVIFRVYNRLAPVNLPAFVRKITTIYRLKEYNPTTLNKDIAILRMKTAVNLGLPNLGTVCLPSPKLITANTYGVAAGWGALSEGGNSPALLHKVALQIFSSRKCRKTLYSNEEITKYMICAGYIGGGKDTCQGDSGGPLMVHVNGKLTQIGITSFGNGCARPGYPGVYTKVKLFLSFINRIIRGSCTCK